jgi:HNH endonuclease
MAFSDKIKRLAKQKSAFRCCLCHKTFVEIHHITPQAEGGADTLDNAAPLCSTCHDLYGGNPEKRKIIRQMRDDWWHLMEKRRKNLTESHDLDRFCEVPINENWEGVLFSKGIVLYHAVFEDEGFEISVKYIHGLLKDAQDNTPNQKRFLFLDIDGHRNKNGGFDHDMYELQRHFLLGFLAPYFTEIHMPLWAIRNKKSQRNDIPEKLGILENLNQKSINEAIDKGAAGIWVAEKDKWMKLE